jgi:hypothetical protein
MSITAKPLIRNLSDSIIAANGEQISEAKAFIALQLRFCSDDE